MSDLAHDAPQPSSQEALVGAAAQLREEYAELLLASGLSARGVGATGAAVAAAEVRPTHTCHFSVSHLAMREAAAQDWVEERARRSANTFARPLFAKERDLAFLRGARVSAPGVVPRPRCARGALVC